MRAVSVFLGALLAAHSKGLAMAETVRVVGGTTFASEIMEPLKEQIEAESGQKILLLPSRTSQGVLALFEGDHIAMSSATTDSIIAELKKANPELPYGQLRTFHVSRTRSAFAVNTVNPVRQLDRATLQLVLTGNIEN